MHVMVNRFLSSHYRRDDGGKVKLKALYDHYRSTLTDKGRGRWSRSRFLSEVSKQFQTGVDGSNTLYVVGITDQAPKVLTVNEEGRIVNGH